MLASAWHRHSGATRPAIGITINEKAVKKHSFQQEIAQRVFHPDGSVGDW